MTSKSLTLIIDTETTGLKKPHMTEVAYSIVELFHGKLNVTQQPRSKRYNPLKPIELGAMATSHICDEDVKNEPSHTDFKLSNSIEYLIGHNIDFDMQVLKNAGVTHAPKLICTQAISRYLMPQLDSHKLVALLYHFHMPVARKQGQHAHSAIYDIYFTQLVLQSLISLASSNGHIMRDFDDLYEFSELARTPTVFSFGKHKGKALTEIEEREKARKAQHEANIEKMTADSFINTDETSSESIKELITNLENKVIGNDWEEYKTQALEVKDNALRRLRTQLESVLKREAEQAELERLRKEEAERKQAEQAKQANIDAEREADKAHRDKVFLDAKDDLVKGGIDETAAEEVVRLIYKNQVRNISIKF